MSKYRDAERAALGFALESETWPVFLEWARQQHVPSVPHDCWLENLDLAQLRSQWLANSPDVIIRSLADKDADV